MARKHCNDRDVPPLLPAAERETCWLCACPLSHRVEWHHPFPKSRKKRETVPVHPICHRTIHARFSNAELARHSVDRRTLAGDPEMARFLRWIATKLPASDVQGALGPPGETQLAQWAPALCSFSRYGGMKVGQTTQPEIGLYGLDVLQFAINAVALRRRRCPIPSRVTSEPSQPPSAEY